MEKVIFPIAIDELDEHGRAELLFLMSEALELPITTIERWIQIQEDYGNCVFQVSIAVDRARILDEVTIEPEMKRWTVEDDGTFQCHGCGRDMEEGERLTSILGESGDGVGMDLCDECSTKISNFLAK